MVKGFKDEDGKFRPTEKKQGISSDDVAGLFDEPSKVNLSNADELKKQKGRIKEIRVFKFDELEPDIQEKVLEKERQSIAEFNDNFFAQDEGILFDKDEKKGGQDIGLKNLFPTNYEVDGNRGTDFIQFELEVDDKKKFYKYLSLSDALMKKVDVDFHNEGDVNTQLEFTDVNGSRIDLAPDVHLADEHYDEDFDKADIPTQDQVKEILHAFDKFDDLMIDALRNLTSNYEFQFQEDTIKENLDANEREFEEDGSPA